MCPLLLNLCPIFAYNAYYAVSVAHAASYWAAVKDQSVALSVVCSCVEHITVSRILSLPASERIQICIAYACREACFTPRWRL